MVIYCLYYLQSLSILHALETRGMFGGEPASVFKSYIRFRRCYADERAAAEEIIFWRKRKVELIMTTDETIKVLCMAYSA